MTTELPAPEPTAPPSRTLLEEGALPPKPGARPESVPEKFWDVEKGQLRVDASGLPDGLLKAHNELERRFGMSADLPPETPDKYDMAPIAKALKEEGKPDYEFDAGMTKVFQDVAHECRLNQKQFDTLVQFYVKDIERLITEHDTKTRAEAEASLKTEWPDPLKFNENLGYAHKVFSTFADPGKAEELMTRYGNDATLIKMFSKVGQELREDRQPNPDGGPTDQDIDTLMRHPAYFDVKHPEHNVIKRAVEAAHLKKYGDRPIMAT